MSSIKYMRNFFPTHSQSTKFVVVGASNNTAKFGYKVLNWYVQRKLPVIPINPTAKEILGVPVYQSLSNYIEASNEKDEDFSISVITPPDVSLLLIDEFTSLKDHINGIWFQPGSYDLRLIRSLKDAGFEEKLIYQGNCILISGDQGLNESGFKL